MYVGSNVQKFLNVLKLKIKSEVQMAQQLTSPRLISLLSLKALKQVKFEWRYEKSEDGVKIPWYEKSGIPP